MEKIKDIGIKKIFYLIDLQSKVNKYYQPQIEIQDKTKNEKFLKFCEKLSSFIFVDELGRKDNISRYRIDKKLDDVIYKSDTGIVCGLKIVKNPLSEINEWEKWENGYIEVFIRMDGDKDGVDWFVWQYIKMSKLNLILNEFKNDLYLL